MGQSIVKKITAKGVCGDIKKLVNMHMVEGEIPNNIVINLFRIHGKCASYNTKSTDYGDSIQLKGTFVATSLLEEDKVYRSGSCYLPDIAADLVAGMLLDNEDVNSVEFAFDIAIKTDSSSVVGYVYEVTPLLEPQEDDSLSRLASSLPAMPTIKAIEASKGSNAAPVEKPATKK